MADKLIETFAAKFSELLALNRKGGGRAVPPEDTIAEFETSVKAAGLPPHRVYLHVLRDGANDVWSRMPAINLLHDPNRVTEDAAKEIAGTLVDVMREPNLHYILGLHTFIAASILRIYDPPTLMLPIPIQSIDNYFMPFAKSVPVPWRNISQPEMTLEYAAHMLAPIARLTVVNNHAYNNLLACKINEFYEAQAAVRGQLEQKGKLSELGSYVIVNTSMEHLAELMDEATKTRDRGLVELLVKTGVVNTFDALEKQRLALGIQSEDVKTYKRQRGGFLAAAKGMGYKVN